MIYFCTPDTARPSGGVRAIYRAVDLLDDAGLDAAVMHTKPGFRCDWFANTTRVVHPPVEVSGADVLVVPEAFTPADMERLPFGIPKVVFNQNAYRTFWSAARRDGVVVATTADHPDVVATLVVSEDNRLLLERALPGRRVVRMHHWIDTTVFHPDAARREQRIVAMPRKRTADFALLVDVLRRRGVLDDWELVTLGDRPEADVAAELRRAALFVALGRDEGFGLPVAEALASGCPVVGFHGMGGRELFGAEYAVAIDDGDVGALARWVEDFVRKYDSSRLHWERLGVAATDFVSSTYSRDRDRHRTSSSASARSTPASEIGASTITKKDLPRPTITERARGGALRLGRRYVSRS